MAARKIKLKDQLGRVINVPVATSPAAPVTPPAPQPEKTGPVATVWKLIREIPANIQKLAKLVGTGFTTRGPDGEWYQRSIEEGEGVAVTNGNGVDGNPTVALAELANVGGGTLQKTLRDGYGRMAGTSDATTADLDEGSNLYFTDGRADSRAVLAVAAHVGEPDPHPQYTTASEAAAAAPVQSVNAKTGAVVLVPADVGLAGGTSSQFWRGDGGWHNGLLGKFGVGTENPIRPLHVVGPDGPVPSMPTIGARFLFVLENNQNANSAVIGSTSGDIGYLCMVSGDNMTRGGIQYSAANDWVHIIAGANQVRLIVRATNGNVLPNSDGIQSLGESSNRWGAMYAATGAINTSDRREKTPVRAFTPSEIAAAIELGGEIGMYQWLGMIEAKGAAARQHIGMTVQGAIAILESHGLDPFAYGFICYDKWVELPEIRDEEGEVVQEHRPAGDRYSFRMDELLAFIARGLVHRLDAVEQRLAAAGL